MMAWFLSFLRGLWPHAWRTKPPPPSAPSSVAPIPAETPPAEAERAIASEADLGPPLAAPSQAEPRFEPPSPPESDLDVESPEDDEPEDIEDAEDMDDDPLAPDPFVSSVRPAMDTLSAADIARRREQALTAALNGEHKIYFSDSAGPGTLAEALNHLLQDGRVTAEFHDEDGEDAHLLYRPK